MAVFKNLFYLDSKKEKSNEKLKTEVSKFNVGEYVQVSSDENLVKSKQKDRGGYSETLMKPMLGKMVIVKHCHKDCVRIEYNGRPFDLHQDVLNKISRSQENDLYELMDNNNLRKMPNYNNSNSLSLSTPNTDNFRIGGRLSVTLENDKSYSDGKSENNISSSENVSTIDDSMPPNEIPSTYYIPSSIKNHNPHPITHNRNHNISPIFEARRNDDPITHNGNHNISPIFEARRNDDPITHNENQNISPIFEVIRNGDLVQLYACIDKNNIESRDLDGNNPLNFACKLGKIDLIDELIQFGVDTKDADKWGNFPIHNCIIYRHFVIADKLIEYDSELKNLKNSNNQIYTELIEDSIPVVSFKNNPNQPTEKNNPNQPTEKNNEMIICKICYTYEVSISFVDCGHTICEDCSNRIAFECPYCKTDIQERIKIIY